MFAAWPPDWTRDRSRLPRVSARGMLYGAVVATLAIALVDFLTGADWSLLVFYVIPIAVVAWRVSWHAAMPSVLIATFGTAAAALQSDGAVLAGWNSATRGLFLLANAWLVSEFRATLDSEHLRARTDALTGVFNRRAFEERAQLELARARRSPLPLSVAFFDLDGLKWVNDHLGHEAGDALLQGFAAAAAGHIRATDALARVGGDEFVALLPGADRAEAAGVVERIVEQFAGHRTASGPASLSVGLVVWGKAPPTSVAELMSVADALMYEAKRRGGGRVLTQEVVPGLTVLPDVLRDEA